MFELALLLKLCGYVRLCPTACVLRGIGERLLAVVRPGSHFRSWASARRSGRATSAACRSASARGSCLRSYCNRWAYTVTDGRATTGKRVSRIGAPANIGDCNLDIQNETAW